MREPRRSRPRARTIAVKRLTRDKMAVEALSPDELSDLEAERPRTRADCRDGVRPCPWVGCKHHLYLEINPETGSIKFVFPELEPWDMAASCALDIAEETHTLEQVGHLTNLTRERVRQVEVKALHAMKAAQAPEP